jgi:hypothetical protein
MGWWNRFLGSINVHKYGLWSATDNQAIIYHAAERLPGQAFRKQRHNARKESRDKEAER